MDVITLSVERREATGKHQIKRLRAAGKVPCILYGGEGKEPLKLAIDRTIVDRELRKHHRVFKLAMEGKERPVYMQEIQFDVLTDEVLHLDFKRIDLDTPLQVSIELVFIGHPKGASRGGALVKDLTHLTIMVPPHLVPHEIQVPVGEVDLGDRINAGDVVLPEGAKLDMPPGTSVCHMPGGGE